MLEEIKQNYTLEAGRIPGWQHLSVSALCNLYIENENNEQLRSAYFSAILLKKWPYIGKHYLNSKASGFSIEDCYDMVVHGIQYALEKRKWRDPKNKLYTDKSAPDKVVNRCIASARDIQYYLSNTGKRKSNYGKVSLDYIAEEVKDCTYVLSDDTEDEDSLSMNVSMHSLLENLIKKNKFIEALIVHSIVNDDCFLEKTKTEKFMYEEEEQKAKKVSYIFKAGKLVDTLYKYREQKLHEFCDEYPVDEEKISKAKAVLLHSDKNKLSRLIKSILIKLSEDQDVRDYLCL